MSMLAPASSNRSTALIFPDVIAQCRAVFFWTLSTALREGLNFSRNFVGSCLGGIKLNRKWSVLERKLLNTSQKINHSSDLWSNSRYKTLSLNKLINNRSKFRTGDSDSRFFSGLLRDTSYTQVLSFYIFYKLASPSQILSALTVNTFIYFHF